MRVWIVRAVLACTACAGAAGCGGSGEPSAQIRAVFTGYEAAVAAGNARAACGYLSTSIQRHLAAAAGTLGSPSELCPLTFGQALLSEDRSSRASQTEIAASLTVRVVSVRGGRATVQVSNRVGSLTETGTGVAVLEGGKWRIAQLPSHETAGADLVYRTPSTGMSPTLMPGAILLVDPTAYAQTVPAIGDIVLFHPPANSQVGCEAHGQGVSVSGAPAGRVCGVAVGAH